MAMTSTWRPDRIADRAYESIRLILPHTAEGQSERIANESKAGRHRPRHDTARAMREANDARQKAERAAEYYRTQGTVSHVVHVITPDLDPGPRLDQSDWVRGAQAAPDPDEKLLPVLPVYRQLVLLCRDANMDRAGFVEAYTALLCRTSTLGPLQPGDKEAPTGDIEPRSVSREEMANLIGGEPWNKSVATGYRWLGWAYHIFAEWSCAEYLKGRIFTQEEIAPMLAWVRSSQSAEGDDDELST